MNVQSIGQTTEEYEHVNQRTGSDIWVPLLFLITLWYTGKVENEYHIWQLIKNWSLQQKIILFELSVSMKYLKSKRLQQESIVCVEQIYTI